MRKLGLGGHVSADFVGWYENWADIWANRRSYDKKGGWTFGRIGIWSINDRTNDEKPVLNTLKQGQEPAPRIKIGKTNLENPPSIGRQSSSCTHVWRSPPDRLSHGHHIQQCHHKFSSRSLKITWLWSNTDMTVYCSVFSPLSWRRILSFRTPTAKLAS